jgi:DNA-binding transcriptional regulator LsrR (DeoR family)
MAKQIVMDAIGDTRHEFDPLNAAAAAEALARFNELRSAGFTAAVRTGAGTSQLVRHFDPAADETVFFPQLRGG